MGAPLTVEILTAASLIVAAGTATGQERYLSAVANRDGTVRIEIADGGSVRRHIEPPNVPDPIWKQVGVKNVRISADGTAVGWLATFSECCADGHALKIVVRTNGNLHVIEAETVIWRWNFIQHGSQVGYMAMPLHGWTVEGYYLVEVTTGRVIATHAHDILDEKAAPLPSWVKAVNAKK